MHAIAGPNSWQGVGTVPELGGGVDDGVGWLWHGENIEGTSGGGQADSG